MPKTISIQSGNEILNNIFYMLKKKGVKQKDLADYLGISRTAITQWKTSKTSSYMNYIDKIALYFGITSNELLNPDKSKFHDSLLLPEELQLIENYRSINKTETKKMLTNLIQALANECK